MNEADTQVMIEAKGLTAPRVKPEDLDDEILRRQFHTFDGSCLTVCCLTLKNGFTVTGQSACADPKNFDLEIGQKIAFDNARNEIWAFLGFRLRDQLHAGVDS